jgi:hypothetical protein
MAGALESTMTEITAKQAQYAEYLWLIIPLGAALFMLLWS